MFTACHISRNVFRAFPEAIKRDLIYSRAFYNCRSSGHANNIIENRKHDRCSKHRLRLFTSGHILNKDEPPPSDKTENFVGVETSERYPKLGKYIPAAVGGVIDGMPRYPSFSSAPGILRASDYFGTVIFAISGSITAASCGLDLFGATAIGTITALGGGTIRDAIILHKQPFWIEEEEYFFMACLVAFMTFFLWPLIPSENVIKTKDEQEGEFLWWGDALGVGTFAIVGAMNACRMCVNPFFAVLCGVVTATFGGMIRDIICGLPKSTSRGRIFHSHSDIYGTTAAAGASVYMITRYLKASLRTRIYSGLIIAIGLRWIAKAFCIGLPSWQQMDFKTEPPAK